MALSLAILCGFVALVTSADPCPTGCNCNNDVISCSQLSSFPEKFVGNGKRVEIFMSVLPTIPANAFENVPNVENIHFQQVKIVTIKSCAFEGLRKNVGIHIELTTIENIEGHAFHDLHGTKEQEFVISSSSIGFISPYAFDFIRGFQTFEIHSIDIREIGNYAFHRFTDITTVNMFDMNVTTLRNNAIEDFTNINVLDVYYSKFTNLECNTFDALRYDLGRNFSFHSLELKCDCGLAWLHDAYTGKQELRLDDVICFEPLKFANEHLINISRSDLCSSETSPCSVPHPALPKQCSDETSAASVAESTAAIILLLLMQMLMI